MATPTLLAGNTVVLKHAPNCFGSGLALEEVYAGALPADVFRTLLISHEDVEAVLETPTVRALSWGPAFSSFFFHDV